MPTGVYLHHSRGPRSEETKRKISEKLMGHPPNPINAEGRAKISARMSGKNNPMYGKHPISTPESREKQSKAWLGKKHTPESKEKMSKALKIADVN